MTASRLLLFLEERCFADPWTVEQIESQIESPGTMLLLINDTGTVRGADLKDCPPVAAGYLLTAGGSDDAALELMRMGVLPEYRRRGFGEKLLRALREIRPVEVFLEVSENNMPARRLYEKSGFAIISRRKKYYPDNSDALIMKFQIPA